MARCILGRLRVMEIRDDLIPVETSSTTEVWPGDKPLLEVNLEHRLKDVSDIRFRFIRRDRGAPIDEKHRHRTRPCRKLPIKPIRIHRPLDHMQLQPTRTRHTENTLAAIASEANRNNFGARMPLPD